MPLERKDGAMYQRVGRIGQGTRVGLQGIQYRHAPFVVAYSKILLQKCKRQGVRDALRCLIRGKDVVGILT